KSSDMLNTVTGKTPFLSVIMTTAISQTSEQPFCFLCSLKIADQVNITPHKLCNSTTQIT
ncbi:hypothetical protein NSP71_26915, partial [Salmonella enterica]|nr:hypothetical protein [Salmonella enterica]